MANQSTFPTTLDGTPTDRTSGDSVPSSDWNTYMDAIDQLEIKVGIDSSAVATTVDYQIKTLPPAGIKSRIVQVVNYQTGSAATGTATIPYDDTAPEITEGTQFLSAAITPTNASNTLLIEVVVMLSNDTSDRWMSIALFKDATTYALASSLRYHELGTEIHPASFTYFMVAGTTSAITFQVRAGGNGAGTTTLNGNSGNRLHGGVLNSSITITEIAV